MYSVPFILSIFPCRKLLSGLYRNANPARTNTDKTHPIHLSPAHARFPVQKSLKIPRILSVCLYFSCLFYTMFSIPLFKSRTDTLPKPARIRFSSGSDAGNTNFCGNLHNNFNYNVIVIVLAKNLNHKIIKNLLL